MAIEQIDQEQLLEETTKEASVVTDIARKRKELIIKKRKQFNKRAWDNITAIAEADQQRRAEQEANALAKNEKYYDPKIVMARLVVPNQFKSPDNALTVELPDHLEIIVPIFTGYIEPYGYLTNALETHCLFNYYLTAMSVYEHYNAGKAPTAYVGEREQELQYENIFKSMLQLYNLKERNVTAAWKLIDLQVLKLGLKPLPDEPKYRHNDHSIILLS